MDGETELTGRIMACAVEVHRRLGPGLLESTYESALCIEMKAKGLTYARQVRIPLHYRGELIAEHRLDLIVEGTIVVEITSVERLAERRPTYRSASAILIISRVRRRSTSPQLMNDRPSRRADRQKKSCACS